VRRFPAVLEQAARAWRAQNSAKLAEDGKAQRRLHAARNAAPLQGSARITLNECAKRYAGDSRKNMAASALVDTDPRATGFARPLAQPLQSCLPSVARATACLRSGAHRIIPLYRRKPRGHGGSLEIRKVASRSSRNDSGCRVTTITFLGVEILDRPMDFADATPVHLANRESLRAILTIDQADFATYLFVGKKRFHVPPIDQP
jgi:hypothetical protein